MITCLIDKRAIFFHDHPNLLRALIYNELQFRAISIKNASVETFPLLEMIFDRFVFISRHVFGKFLCIHLWFLL